MKEKRTYQGLFCLGGSFNPIHNGHLHICEYAGKSLGCPRITLIPSAQPPHKMRQNDVVSPLHRLTMCRIAAANSQLIEVNDIEIQRQGPSYTYDTIMALKALGQKKIYWLLGADMLMDLPKWHKAAELVRIAHFFIIARPGVQLQWEQLPAQFQHLKDNLLPIPLIDISATRIRETIARNQPVDKLIPAGVASYIKENRLYRSENV